jgi:hypothetical protein
LYRIISGVLQWDASNFTKSTEKIEKAKDGPSLEHLNAIKRHVQESRDTHDQVREASIDSTESVVVSIFRLSKDPELVSSAESLDVNRHRLCLQYYSALLSARDRTAITNLLCRQTPDLLTEAVRECVGAFEPMIRLIHEEIDLSEHLAATQAFMDDFLKISAPNKTNTAAKPNGFKRAKGNERDCTLPSVEDYVDLLCRHRLSVFKWLHHVCSKCPPIRDAVRDWAKEVAKALGGQRHLATGTDDNDRSSTTALPALQSLFTSLPLQAQSRLLPVLDSHATYLSHLRSVSHARTCDISAPHRSRTVLGPGMYLASWQHLLDQTLITPDVQGGIRTGRDVIDRTTPGKPNASGGITLDGQLETRHVDHQPVCPDVSEVISRLGSPFRALLQDIARKAAAEVVRT